MFGDEMRIGLDHGAVEALDSNAVAARRRGERGGDDVRIRKLELRLRSGGVEQGEGRDGQRCIADDAAAPRPRA
jgi:hypothetical protein